jgi:hypothetical protein
LKSESDLLFGVEALPTSLSVPESEDETTALGVPSSDTTPASVSSKTTLSVVVSAVVPESELEI